MNFVVEYYFSIYPFILCQQVFQAFSTKAVLNKTMASHLIRKFHDNGSVLIQKCSHRHMILSNNTVRYEAQFTAVPLNKAMIKMSQLQNMSLDKAHNITKLLKLQVYHIHVLHELWSTNHALDCAAVTGLKTLFLMILKCWTTPFSDKALFYLKSYVNSHNSQLWSTDKLRAYNESPLHQAKIVIWWEVSQCRVTGSIFFKVTVAAECYQNNFMQFCFGWRLIRVIGVFNNSHLPHLGNKHGITASII
jgi:hypothetical protein